MTTEEKKRNIITPIVFYVIVISIIIATYLGEMTQGEALIGVILAAIYQKY